MSKKTINAGGTGLPKEELARNILAFMHENQAFFVSLKGIILMVIQNDFSTTVGKASKFILQYLERISEINAKHFVMFEKVRAGPVEDIKKWVTEYKRLLDEANIFIEKFEDFWKRNKVAIIKDFNFRFEKRYKKRFEEMWGYSFQTFVEHHLQYRRKYVSTSKIGLPTNIFGGSKKRMASFFKEREKRQKLKLQRKVVRKQLSLRRKP